MYRLIDSSYTLADIGRFTELSIRRGIPLASVVKTEPRDRRVVVGAALLFVPTVAFSEETLLQRFEGFLQGAGSWLKAEPAELLASALEEGLLEAAEDPQDGAPARWRSRLEPLPGVTANRLADELEAAQEILKLRRARMRETLQAKNREVNRPPEPPVDAEADRSFMRMALEEAQAAGMAGEIPVGAVVVADGKVIARASQRRSYGACRNRFAACCRCRPRQSSAHQHDALRHAGTVSNVCGRHCRGTVPPYCLRRRRQPARRSRGCLSAF